WVRGPVAGGRFEAASPDGSMTLAGAVRGDRAEGTVTCKAGALTFSAALGRIEETLAGLYRAEEKDDDQDYVAGWVVDEDGNVAGAVQDRKNKQVLTPKPKAGAPNLTAGKGTTGQQVKS